MFPHSQHAYERMLSLPLYTRMLDADVERVGRCAPREMTRRCSRPRGDLAA